MNRHDKIKLLQKVAKGDNSGLIALNKGLVVIFLELIENTFYWIDFDVYMDKSTENGLTDEQIKDIFHDNSIKKYTSNDLKQIQKRSFVMAMPPELFYNHTETEIMENYNKYFKNE